MITVSRGEARRGTAQAPHTRATRTVHAHARACTRMHIQIHGVPGVAGMWLTSASMSAWCASPSFMVPSSECPSHLPVHSPRPTCQGLPVRSSLPSLSTRWTSPNHQTCSTKTLTSIGCLKHLWGKHSVEGSLANVALSRPAEWWQAQGGQGTVSSALLRAACNGTGVRQ